MVQVAPAQTCRLPAPSLKIVRTSLVALNPASRVEAVVLVKSEVVTAVPCKAKVLAVTVPEIAGSDAIVTLLPTVTEEMLMGTVPLIDAVTEPIWAVPAPMVTVPAPIVTTPMRCTLGCKDAIVANSPLSVNFNACQCAPSISAVQPPTGIIVVPTG